MNYPCKETKKINNRPRLVKNEPPSYKHDIKGDENYDNLLTKTI